MTVPPPPDPGFLPPWNRPSAGTAWSTDEPPAGLPPQGYPSQGYAAGYPQQGYPAAGYPPPYPAPGYPGQPPARPGTNGFAITAPVSLYTSPSPRDRS